MRKTWMVTTAGVAALIATQLVGAEPAHAVSGLVAVHDISPPGIASSKSAHADCPAGKKVVGGGGVIVLLDQTDSTKVRLEELRPVHPGGGVDGYVAGAMDFGGVSTGTWTVFAFAVCADPIPGLHLVGGSGPLGSATVQSVDARCGAGEVALGGGGLVRNPAFQANLRTVAPSANGDRFTVQGGEDADGYADKWSVVAYAMCAPRPAGYQVVATTGSGRPTESRKAATTICPVGTRMHGAGGVIRSSAPGGVGLEQVFPQDSLAGSQALGVMTEPVTVDWGPVQALAICAN